MDKKRAVLSILALGVAGMTGPGCAGRVENDKVADHRAALHRMKDCGQLESELKADAITKMNARINALIASLDEAGAGRHGWGPTAGASDDMNSAAAGGSSQGSYAPPSSEKSGASEASQTNTQVDGVDEADIIRNDNKFIYILHGQSFVVVNAWPASELAQTSSFAIEGQPSEMYVTEDGKVVIYSRVDGAPIYAAAGIQPRQTYSDYWGFPGGTMTDVATVGVGSASPGGGYYYANPLTKVTVLSIDSSAAPSLVSENYFEGSYTSSRRVGRFVRTVLQGAAYGPQLQYYPSYTTSAQYPQTKVDWTLAYEKLRQENAAKINRSTLTDWLPYSISRSASGLQANLAKCDEFYVPTVGTTTYGMTQVQSLDLDNPTASPRSANIVGQVSTMYSSAGAMYLASQGWIDYGPMPVSVRSASSSSQTSAPPDSGLLLSTTYTHIHKLDLATDPGQPTYVGSGTVPGYVVNQFALDEHNGYLRVAVTDDRYSTTSWQSSRVNHLFVLGTERDALKVTGSVLNLAPTEKVYSARFLDDRGYLVTFRQVDPLFVFDLSNPAAPIKLGELKIPGFSEYMHPLDSGHLLTIGQGEDRRLALQIFDVTNPLDPKQTHVYSFSGEEWGRSEAESNHKAFTYFASRKLLAFPFVGNGIAPDYMMRSSLELFQVDVATGFTKLGSIDHSPLFDATTQQGWCGGYYGVEVRRGVFMDNIVYSVSHAGVMAHNTSDLTTPIASLELDHPVSDLPYCGSVRE